MGTAATHALREGLLLVLILAAPPTLAALAAGLVANLLGGAMRVRDPSLSVVPKVLAALLALGFAGPFIGGRAAAFAHALLDAVPELARAT